MGGINITQPQSESPTGAPNSVSVIKGMRKMLKEGVFSHPSHAERSYLPTLCMLGVTDSPMFFFLYK